MSVTDNVMELKNGCHPHFREHPLTPSDNMSMALTFSGTAGLKCHDHSQTTLLCADSENIIAVTLLLPFL